MVQRVERGVVGRRARAAMVIGIIAGLHGITDEELNELALAVAAELSRRQAENLAAPEPGAEPPAATSQAEAFVL